MLDDKPRRPAKALFAAIAVSTIAITTSAARAAEPNLAQTLLSGDAPVSISACEVMPTYATVSAGESGVSTVSMGANLRIDFLNRSAQPITDVTFVLTAPDGQVGITDRGWFSSGVSIQHVLGPYDHLSRDAACAVYSVRFDDGTLWERT
jgi:hypothetical protein